MSVMSDNTIMLPNDYKIDAENLNDLPADIHECILDYLDLQDYLVSKIWDSRLHIDAVVPDLRSAIKNDVVILEEGKDPLGNKPFCILEYALKRSRTSRAI